MTELIIVISVIIITALLFWPKLKVAAGGKKAKDLQDRILAEDALKHLYDCEYKSIYSTVQSVAGNMNISYDKASELIQKIESLGLVKTGDFLELTEEGRSYALKIVRVHRLWEKYLADHTSVPEEQWHREAELKEHTVSKDEAERLAAVLGNPLFDPHGDPIPNPEGRLPEKNWRPLSSLQENETAQIVHLEDEPESVYKQLVHAGLYKGIHVKMISRTGGEVCFEANGKRIALAPLPANNIAVGPISMFEKVPEKYKTLLDLKSGEEAEVIALSKACRGSQRRRLMDLGVVPGSKIKYEFGSTWGDPAAYKIRGAVIGLRKNQAQHIYIKN